MPPKKERKILASEEVSKDIQKFLVKKIMKVLLMKMSV